MSWTRLCDDTLGLSRSIDEVTLRWWRSDGTSGELALVYDVLYGAVLDVSFETFISVGRGLSALMMLAERLSSCLQAAQQQLVPPGRARLDNEEPISVDRPK